MTDQAMLRRIRVIRRPEKLRSLIEVSQYCLRGHLCSHHMIHEHHGDGHGSSAC